MPLAQLISPQQLAERQKSTGLVILDCRFALEDPDYGLCSYAEGHIDGSQYADLERHLTGSDEKKDAEREKAREEARKKFEEEAAKKNPLKPLPEFGSEEDFPLAQAINRLKGKPVIVSKTVVERRAEAPATN